MRMKDVTAQMMRDADDRRRALLAKAEERYPVADGYTHDVESNGWPDSRCVVAVYRETCDKRRKTGVRFDRVATVTR